MVQDQQFTPTIGIPWLLNGLHLPYLQRIVYKHIIVSPATWLFKSDALREIADQASAKRWAASAQLPDRFSVQGKDGTCTIIDLNSSASVKMFLRMTAGDQDIVIQEFLFDQLGSAVEDDRGGEYLNQLIFSFMKTIPARSHA